MTANQGKRILAIDRYRGIAILLLVATLPMYFIDAFDFTDPFTTHIISDAFRLVPNYAFYDLVAPVFIFAAGLSFSLSFAKNKAKHGGLAATRKTVFRSLRLIAVGTMLLYFGDSLIDDIYRIVTYIVTGMAGLWFLLWLIKVDARNLVARVLDVTVIVFGLAALLVGVGETIFLLVAGDLPFEHWNVLQSIGFASLITLVFHNLKQYCKLAAALAAFFLYALIYELIGYNGFASMSHGGVLGSLGWGILMVFADLIGQLAVSDKKQMYLVGTALVIFGIGGYLLFDCNKYSVSPGYVAMSLSLSFGLYVIIGLFDFWKTNNGLIVSLGRNTILVYIIHMVAGTYVGIYLNYYAYLYDAEFVAYAGLFLYLMIILGLGFFLNRKRIYFKL